VTSLAAPVAYLAIVLAPGMNGAVTNGDLSFVSSFAFEVRSLVHVMVDAVANMGNSVGSG